MEHDLLLRAAARAIYDACYPSDDWSPTGFDEAELKSLYEKMRSLQTGTKPFDHKVKHENETTWIVPRLVGEVKFTEWTSDGEMRHPVFLGLRTDKKALDVIRE